MSDIEVKKMPAELQKKIDELFTEARIAYDNGDVAHFLTLELKKWNLIPEPKEAYTFDSQTTSRMIAETYLELGNAEKFKEWMKIVYQMSHDPKAETFSVCDSLMNEGIGLYKLKHFDEALAIFRKAYRIAGRNAFPLEYIEYYKFMMANQERP